MSNGMGPHHDEAWLKSLGKNRKDWGKPVKPRESIRDRTIANQYRERERDKLLRLQNLERRQTILDGETAGEQAVLAIPGLIGFWPLQEPSGEAVDFSQYERDLGIPVGADSPHTPHNIWQVSGPTDNIPYGVEFDPTGYIVHTNTLQTGFGRSGGSDWGIDGVDAFSVEFWYKPDASGSDSSNLVGIFSSYPKGWMVYVGSGAGRLTPVFSRFGASTVENVSAPNPLVANTWAHIVCTFDGAEMSMYINGVLVGSTASTQSIPNAGSDFLVAGSTVSAGTQVTQLTGALSWISLYNIVLTQQDISDHYLLGAQGTTSVPIDLPVFAANPTTPATGYTYLNSGDGTVRVWSGSTWLIFSSGLPGEVDLDIHASNPSSPADGRTYYNSGDDTIRVYNGTAWKTFHSGVQSLEVFENGS